MTTSMKIQTCRLIRPLVLVVDDDPGVLEALHTLLAPRLEPVYRVETAASAEEALELLSKPQEDAVESPVALIITDEKMPGRSGTDLLVALRQHPDHRDGGRIIITAYAGLASAERAINEAEVDRYYPKPWDAEGSLLPAAGQSLARFARKRGLDRFLLAAPAAGPELFEEIRRVRRAWWEYVTLLGGPAEEMDAEVPSFREPEDNGAVQILAHRLAPGENIPAAAVRLRPTGPDAPWMLDALVFLPEEAGDDLETLIVRAALLEAVSRRVAAVRTHAPLLRREVYEALGFSPPPATGDNAEEAAPGTILLEIHPGTAAGDGPFAKKFRAERRLCACAQTGCPGNDYADARRNYFCPLDITENRLPQGFPGSAAR
jgi:CheY-like chemotaxis protein